MKRHKPDWKNPDDYRFDHFFLSKRESYAWEFLRRNQEYRKVWERELESYLSKMSSSSHKAMEIDNPWFCIFPEDPEILKYWGLPWLVDPDDDNPYIDFKNRIRLHKTEAFVLGVPKDILTDNETLTVEEGMAGVLFDLRRPLRSQLEIIENLLRHYQNKLIKKGLKIRKPQDRFEEWEKYLRIIDARESGAKYDDIAQVIYRKEYNENSAESQANRAEKAYARAVALVNRGYIDLIRKP